MAMTSVADGLGFTEGPLWLPDGTVACTSITQACIFLIAADGHRRTVSTGGGPNGLAADAAGNLYVAQNGGIWGGHEGAQPGIQVVQPDGSVDYLVSLDDGAPNDLCFGPDGRLWFTDPRGPSDLNDPATALPGRLYSCRADGTDLLLHHEGVAFINGLAFTADQDVLLLAETSGRRILSYRWRDGTQPQPVIALAQGFPDGFAIDTAGSIWVAATFDDAIHVYDTQGHLEARHDTGPDSLPTNCCFGGPDGTDLYVAASGAGAILRQPVGAAGLALL